MRTRGSASAPWDGPGGRAAVLPVCLAAVLLLAGARGRAAGAPPSPAPATTPPATAPAVEAAAPAATSTTPPPVATAPAAAAATAPEAGTPRAAAAGTQAPAVAPAPAEVTLGGHTLFSVLTRVGSVSPAERARLISDRLQRLAADPLLRSATARVEDDGTESEVLVGDTLVMVVTAADAAEAGVGRTELAATRAAAITEALQRFSILGNLKELLLGLLFSLLATVALLVCLRSLARLFPTIYAAMERWQATWIPEVKIQKLVLLSDQRIASLVKALARVVRLLLTLVLLYAYVSLVFSFFPWTRGLASQLLDYVLTPLATLGRGLVAFVPDLFFIVVIVLVTRGVLKLIRLVFDGLESGAITAPGFFPDWAQPTYKIVRFMALVLAAVMIYPYIPGSSTSAFKGISVFLGVLVSLGSTSAVANVVAGLMLTYMRPFQLGDRVRIADTVGDVIEKTLLVTRVRTVKNVDITIPNAMVLASHVVNYSSCARDRGLVLHTAVTIGYDADWRRVHALMVEAARRTDHVMAEPPPFVLQTALGDFTVTYELNAVTTEPQLMAATYSQLHANVQDVFAEAGVEIMSPAFTAVRDGNAMAIPPDRLPTGYRPRPFEVALAPARPEPDGPERPTPPDREPPPGS